MSDTSSHANLIDGQWVASSEIFENRNPARPSEVVARHCLGSEGDVHAAALAAANAQAAWRESSIQERADLLEKIGTELGARASEIGTILSREEGKTLGEGIGEVSRAAQIFKFFAQEALRIPGQSGQSVRKGVEVQVLREPLGTVGIITPWNFPIAIPAWKIAPALAFGNCVVIKPAEMTPTSCHLLAEIITNCGAPDGVFNLVNGAGSIVGNAIVEHPRIDAISFTGSTATGRAIAQKAIDGLKKIQLEMGGKNPALVCASADLELASNTILNAAFYSTGQRCTATSRIIVVEEVHDQLVELIARKMHSLKVGDPLESETQIGPVISLQQLESNLSYVRLAQEEGATIEGGQRLESDTGGFFQSPALFFNATNDMRISQEEIFGPCASVIRVADFDEALVAANDTKYGLSAGIFTNNLREASEFRRRSTAGMVMVNLPTAGVDYHVPFGGRAESSYGAREQGRSAVEFFTSVKTAYVAA